MELLAWSLSPLSGVPGTTGEGSLFAEGLLSADTEGLQSGSLGVSCCCEFATLVLPLSPELVLPDSLVSLEGRPLLLSWGVSVDDLPCPQVA